LAFNDMSGKLVRCFSVAQCTTGLHLLTPWCRVLLEKLIGLQLVKKFPAFHRTRRFITALTSVRQLSPSWASPIQCIYPHPTSWRSILILSTHLRLGLPSGSFPPVSPARPYIPPLLNHTSHMPSPYWSPRSTRNTRSVLRTPQWTHNQPTGSDHLHSHGTTSYAAKIPLSRQLLRIGTR